MKIRRSSHGPVEHALDEVAHAAGLYTANDLLGEFFHARGVARKPGGWRLWTYNLPMGPPISAPGLMAMVGGMGLLASVLRQER